MMKAILTYHSIDPSGSVVSVHPDRFRQHMELLEERHVPVLPLAELLDADRTAGVALTFDDGFENFADTAWPLMRDRGFPATVFVATDWVGRQNAWDPDDGAVPRLPLMDWPMLSRLVDEGVEIGSHTRSHPRLPALADDRLELELVESRATIETRLGVSPRSLAYPYGAHDARVARATKAAGYASALTTELRPLDRASSDPFALPRLDAFYLAKPGVMEMWGTTALGRYITFRRAARNTRAAVRQLGRRR